MPEKCAHLLGSSEGKKEQSTLQQTLLLAKGTPYPHQFRALKKESITHDYTSLVTVPNYSCSFTNKMPETDVNSNTFSKMWIVSGIINISFKCSTEHCTMLINVFIHQT